MPLNSSGPISLAGTTAGQSIELENGGNGTTQISLNDAAVRSLAGVASGAITMPTNFWGKSNRVSISYTFTTNTNNASLNVTSISGYSSGKSDITITVNSGIYLWSSSSGTAGLTLSGGSTGDAITLVNNGYIMGQGGNGGGGFQSANFPGQPGGPAISLGFDTTINNTNASAYIGGGGGGGGSGGGGSGGGGAGGGNGGQRVGCTGFQGNGGSIGSAGNNGTLGNAFASGAGGGRIFPGTGGSGGYNMCCYICPQGGGAGGGAGSSGRYGTPSRGGNGGSANAAGGTAQCAGGGGGGGWGAAGANGLSGTTYSGGSGGKAVALNGRTVTWVSGNTTRVYGSVS